MEPNSIVLPAGEWPTRFKFVQSCGCGMDIDAHTVADALAVLTADYMTHAGNSRQGPRLTGRLLKYPGLQVATVEINYITGAVVWTLGGPCSPAVTAGTTPAPGAGRCSMRSCPMTTPTRPATVPDTSTSAKTAARSWATAERRNPYKEKTMEVQFQFANRMTDAEICIIRDRLAGDDRRIVTAMESKFHKYMESMRSVIEAESTNGLARYSYRLVSDSGEVIFEGPKGNSECGPPAASDSPYSRHFCDQVLRYPGAGTP